MIQAKSANDDLLFASVQLFEDRQDQIQGILEKLDAREQEIIIRRFGLDHRHEPLTLKEVGETMGV
ncbi:MAG: sigma factor-like helix-turn-helix DNA-binding protein, partial [Pirellulaceae bacterium]